MLLNSKSKDNASAETETVATLQAKKRNFTASRRWIIFKDPKDEPEKLNNQLQSKIQ